MYCMNSLIDYVQTWNIRRLSGKGVIKRVGQRIQQSDTSKYTCKYMTYQPVYVAHAMKITMESTIIKHMYIHVLLWDIRKGSGPATFVCPNIAQNKKKSNSNSENVLVNQVGQSI